MVSFRRFCPVLLSADSISLLVCLVAWLGVPGSLARVSHCSRDQAVLSDPTERTNTLEPNEFY